MEDGLKRNLLDWILSKLKKAKKPYKSKLEEWFALQLKRSKLCFGYEEDKFEYTRPQSYLPDFKVGRKIYIETKGYFPSVDRTKMRLVKEQHPEVTIHLFFGDGDKKIHKKSKTTYGQWAEKNGFEWSDVRRGIPREWLRGV